MRETTTRRRGARADTVGVVFTALFLYISLLVKFVSHVHTHSHGYKELRANPCGHA